MWYNWSEIWHEVKYWCNLKTRVAVFLGENLNLSITSTSQGCWEPLWIFFLRNNYWVTAYFSVEIFDFWFFTFSYCSCCLSLVHTQGWGKVLPFLFPKSLCKGVLVSWIWKKNRSFECLLPLWIGTLVKTKHRKSIDRNKTNFWTITKGK